MDQSNEVENVNVQHESDQKTKRINPQLGSIKEKRECKC